jgi:hypothetical protein
MMYPDVNLTIINDYEWLSIPVISSQAVYELKAFSF